MSGRAPGRYLTKIVGDDEPRPARWVTRGWVREGEFYEDEDVEVVSGPILESGWQGIAYSHLARMTEKNDREHREKMAEVGMKKARDLRQIKVLLVVATLITLAVLWL